MANRRSLVSRPPQPGGRGAFGGGTAGDAHLSLAQQWAKRSKDAQTIVTDKQGRQRFHGAFTGGFSAGHYMTVGTEEGWTPGTFVSSRAPGGKARQPRVQRPEDFMDEDDDGAMGRRLDARSAYAGPDLAARRARRADSEQAAGAGAGASAGAPSSATANSSSLVVAAPPSVGEQLMNAMGWRRGHGVGPRRMNRDTGCYSIPSDTAIEDVVPKNNAYGLGYRALRPGQQRVGAGGADSQRRLLDVDHRNSSIGAAAAAGFGLGALEEVGDDALAFATDDRSEYDTTLGAEEDDTDAYFHANALRANKKGGGNRGGGPARSAAELRRRMLGRLTAGGGRDALGGSLQQPQQQAARCSDGAPPLAGFVLEPAGTLRAGFLRRVFEPPPPPRGFVARHHFAAPAPLLRHRQQQQQQQQWRRGGAGPLRDELGTDDDAAAFQRRQRGAAGADGRGAGARRPTVDARLRAPRSGWETAAAAAPPVDGGGAVRPQLGRVPAAVQALAASMAARFTKGGVQDSTGTIQPTPEAAAEAAAAATREAARAPVVRTTEPWQPTTLLSKRFVLPPVTADTARAASTAAAGGAGAGGAAGAGAPAAPRAGAGVRALAGAHQSHAMQKRLLQTLHGVNPPPSSAAAAPFAGVAPSGFHGGGGGGGAKPSSEAIDSFLQSVQQEVLTERELFMRAYPDAPPLPPLPPPPLSSASAAVAGATAPPPAPPPPLPDPAVGGSGGVAAKGVSLFNEIFNDASSSDSDSDSDGDDGEGVGGGGGAGPGIPARAPAAAAGRAVATATAAPRLSPAAGRPGAGKPLVDPLGGAVPSAAAVAAARRVLAAMGDGSGGGRGGGGGSSSSSSSSDDSSSASGGSGSDSDQHRKKRRRRKKHSKHSRRSGSSSDRHHRDRRSEKRSKKAKRSKKSKKGDEREERDRHRRKKSSKKGDKKSSSRRDR